MPIGFIFIKKKRINTDRRGMARFVILLGWREKEEKREMREERREERGKIDGLHSGPSSWRILDYLCDFST